MVSQTIQKIPTKSTQYDNNSYFLLLWLELLYKIFYNFQTGEKLSRPT